MDDVMLGGQQRQVHADVIKAAPYLVSAGIAIYKSFGKRPEQDTTEAELLAWDLLIDALEMAGVNLDALEVTCRDDIESTDGG
jgi:hypothetical protein